MTLRHLYARNTILVALAMQNEHVLLYASSTYGPPINPPNGTQMKPTLTSTASHDRFITTDEAPGGPRFGTVVLDVDSTISGIEGIDWLARRRGEIIAHKGASRTDAAMRGEIPLESVY